MLAGYDGTMGHDRSDVASDPTVAATQADVPTARDSRPSLRGYRVAELLGAGGMGEVVVAHDDRIGRDVAVKRMRSDAPSAAATARFLREAQIQARLEHPAIVPVHEIGTDEHGQPYFTMKRIAGTTLDERLARDRSPQALLREFADICLAIDFAHARSVVHRDLKPANIILGDFGEVYVLDWGLARVVGDRDERSIGSDVQSLDGMTQAGAMLGTPGYMAPEQVHDATSVGTAADVYSLGAILFELLAREPLHPRGKAALTSTIAGVDGSPARRKPELDIPPELDALCIAALATDPANRPRVRELADRVQRYLDGDRDLASRRARSAEQLALARETLVSGDTARATRAAGYALALDPESREAIELVTRLLLEPPLKLPPALTAELSATENAVQRRQSRVAALSFVAVAAFLVALCIDGVTDWGAWTAIAATAAVMAFAAWRLSRRTPRPHEMIFVVLGNALLAAMLSRVFGSLILVPSVTCVMALSLTSYPQLVDRARLVIAILAASWLVPVVLERLGVLSETWRIAGGAIASIPRVANLGSGLLVAASLTPVIVVGLFANALARSRRDAQRTLQIQAWQLRQLLPE
jgi:serine/threonine protein kinase